jgi:hypothetical protein
MNTGREHDPSDVLEIAWSLCAALMCRCDHCGVILDLGHEDLLDTDPKLWADAVAPVAKAQGWIASGCFAVRCPLCKGESAQI